MDGKAARDRIGNSQDGGAQESETVVSDGPRNRRFSYARTKNRLGMATGVNLRGLFAKAQILAATGANQLRSEFTAT